MEEAPSWLSLVLDAPRGNGQRSKGAGTKESCCYPAMLASGGWTVPRGTRSHAPAPRRLWVWVNTAGGGCRPPVVPTALEEEKLLEKTRPAGRCPGRGGGSCSHFCSPACPIPLPGQGGGGSGQVRMALFSIRSGFSRRIHLPPPVHPGHLLGLLSGVLAWKDLHPGHIS